MRILLYSGCDFFTMGTKGSRYLYIDGFFAAYSVLADGVFGGFGGVGLVGKGRGGVVVVSLRL